MATSKHIIAMSMLEGIRDRVLFTYFKSLELSKQELTLEKQELASRVWDDMVDFAIFHKGDISALLEAGLEVIIDNAIEDYTASG